MNGQNSDERIFPTTAPANFNGELPVINPDDAVMLLIDHQSGLFQTVNDMPMTALRRHAGALASMATLANIPVITTASVPQGPNGPLIPKIHQNAPHAKYVGRKGEINAWHNPRIRAGGEGHGPQDADYCEHHHQRLHGIPGDFGDCRWL